MPRILNKDLEIYYFEVISISRSFFGILSRETNSSILLNVSPLPYENKYLVFAYTYSDIKDYVRKIYMRYKSMERYIKSLRAYRINRGTLIIAVKEACPFIEIALKHNIIVVSPYIFDRGVRKYLVVGTPDNINEYIFHVVERYGRNNTFIERVRNVERLKKFIAIQKFNNILDKLTRRELEVLRKAYELGIFDYPRRIDLDTLSKELKISKVTISILIRKSLKKIIEDIFNSVIE